MTQPPKYRVLVVDDEPAMLLSIEAVLSGDVHVTTTTSPERAVSLLARESFQVVCSDFRMPQMTGTELLRHVAAKDEYTSCLLITGADEYFTGRASNGRNFVLLKPFDPERLIALVLQLARVAEMKRQVRRTDAVIAASSARAPTASSTDLGVDGPRLTKTKIA